MPNVAEHRGNPVWQRPSLTVSQNVQRLAPRHPEMEQLRRVKATADAETLTVPSDLTVAASDTLHG